MCVEGHHSVTCMYFTWKTGCALHFGIHAIPNFSARCGGGTNFHLVDAANPVSLRIEKCCLPHSNQNNEKIQRTVGIIY